MKKFLALVALVMVTAAGSAEPAPTVVEQWGGEGIEVLLLDDGSARIQFDCAAGWVEPKDWPQTKSKINVKGTLVRHTGVRPPPGYRPPRYAATYKASIDRKKGVMTFTSKIGKERAERYSLKLNEEPVLRRCM
ncbi:MAG: hypothetical protein IT288_10650 [Bdellovibrionales bacterium]|nr:hypothetical protein [Bdellovibrionales bacterium]